MFYKIDTDEQGSPIITVSELGDYDLLKSDKRAYAKAFAVQYKIIT